MSYSRRRAGSFSNRSQHGGYRRPQNSNRSSRNKGANIDVSRYIQKAVEPQITVDYTPTHSFQDFGLNEQLLANVLNHGYKSPTPVQDQAIPELMAGKDVVGIANTGTGKTAAFLLPLITKVINNPDQGVLILAPTRELAVQILEEWEVFAQGLRIGATLCIGGANINSQISRLRNNPHFVIGTPGRIKDLIERRAFHPEFFENIVLDEVDRMLDIGFRKDILFLISQLPQKRQGAFFSATIDRQAEEIMHSLLTDPVMINVRQAQTAKSVHQDIVPISQGENKVDVLHNLLTQKDFEKVIVFGRTKHGIDKLERQLNERGVRVTAIHGNKTQGARLRSLRDFKQGRIRALLATDVASRGIDVDDVTHVINYDEPTTYADYVHRIGRTGRAGKVGKALTFIAR